MKGEASSATMRILVPVDFSVESRMAAHYALHLSEASNPTVDVLHVWDMPLYLGPYPMVQSSEGPMMSLLDFARSKAENSMVSFFAALEEDLNDSMEQHHYVQLNRRLEPGRPADVIVRLAAEEGYDLIVMGTHGRSGLAHFLIGSVAEEVAREAPCPVVIVPARAATSMVAEGWR